MKMKNLYKMIAMLAMAFVMTLALPSCSDDDKDEPTLESSLYGQWEHVGYADGINYNVVIQFNKDHTGYITESLDTRAEIRQTMDFNWSVSTASNGQTILKIIRTANSDSNVGPFDTDYGQFSTGYTVAGNILTINYVEDTGYMMRFEKK